MPNFVVTVEATAEIQRFIDFQDGGGLPSWICYTCVWITHKEYLVFFIFVQNMVRIGAVVSIICQF